MSTKQPLTESPLSVVHEVLRDWLEENEATDFDENDVAHFFGLLGTAGYSIVPNVDEAKLAKLNDHVLHNLANGPLFIQAGVRWVQRTRVLSVLEQLTQAGSEVLARLRASEAKVRELTEQLPKAGGWASLPSDFQAVLHLSKSAQTLTKLVGVLDRLPKSMVRKMSADAEEAMFNARTEAINLAAAIKPVIDQLNASATKLMEGSQPHA